MTDIYKKFYVERDYEQTDLFEQLARQFGCERAIYPGSYVHISPSFSIPCVCYIDADKQAAEFFQDQERVLNLINERKIYSENAKIKFNPQDYTEPAAEESGSFDLLISQYAGFICQPCKHYLKTGGKLLVNNSHGDAGIAALDQDFCLTGVFHRRNSCYIFSDQDLQQYFIPKTGTVTKNQILQSRKGAVYSRTATLYLFEKNN